MYEIISNNGERLLIDCGLAWSTMLKKLNYNLNGIVGLLCDHEHKDHSKSVQDVLRAGIPVYASEGTFDSLGIRHRNAKVLDKMLSWRAISPTFSVFAFPIEHDAAQPLGYIVAADGEHLLFVTDTSHITQRFNIPFDIIAIECSYDGDILRECVDDERIAEPVAKRLLKSHLERHVTLRYLTEFCNLKKCREIHLLHCSERCLDRRQAAIEIENQCFVKVL
jgi:phosphoribosyl 1,2-cyclic phosphodiesterase